MGYKCDDAQRKKIAKLGATPWYQSVADDSRISIISVIATDYRHKCVSKKVSVGAGHFLNG
jgi:hypothetical protein